MTTRAEYEAWTSALIADFRAHDGQLTIGPMAGRNLLLLGTTGAKSGQARVAQVAYSRDGENYVVAASNQGRPTDPAWLANLRANPEVTVEVGPETFRARATIASGAEHRRLWASHVAAMPAFADYEKTTPRVIPVVSLERIREG